MKNKDWQVCSECKKERQRCRAANVDSSGNIEWVCRQCWKDKDYDSYLYEHHQPGYGHGV